MDRLLDGDDGEGHELERRVDAKVMRRAMGKMVDRLDLVEKQSNDLKTSLDAIVSSLRIGLDLDIKNPDSLRAKAEEQAFVQRAKTIGSRIYNAVIFALGIGAIYLVAKSDYFGK